MGLKGLVAEREASIVFFGRRSRAFDLLEVPPASFLCREQYNAWHPP